MEVDEQVEDFADHESDVSNDDSFYENSSKSGVINFDASPKSARFHAAKIRQIERKIMLGQLSDTEESKLRNSRFFSNRFDKLLNISKSTSKANLYNLVKQIHLNPAIFDDLVKKSNDLKTPNNIRRKANQKVLQLRLREKTIQEKLANNSASASDINKYLCDMYFTVEFGENLPSLDHTNLYKAEDKKHGEMVCDYCQLGIVKNRYGQYEELLICKDCENKAHPSCLGYSPELTEKIRADGSWQCIDCKVCIICNGSDDPDSLLFCDACDKGYHMNCHSPKVDKMPSGKWVCMTCSLQKKAASQTVFLVDDNDDENVKPNQVPDISKSPEKIQQKHPEAQYPDIAMASSPPGHHTKQPAAQAPYMHGAPGMVPTVVGPPHQRPMGVQMVPVSYIIPNNVQHPQSSQFPTHVLGKGVKENMAGVMNPGVTLPDVRSSIREDVLRSLPMDVADWTVKDVAFYFKSHGYIEEGVLLQEQEVDGRALLLMSRNDCLTGLKIKLGPALKIYHMHIHKLQMRTEFLG